MQTILRQFIDTLMISFIVTCAFYIFVDVSYYEIVIIFSTAWFFSWSVCYMTLPACLIVESDNIFVDELKISTILNSQKYKKTTKNGLDFYLPKIPDFMIWKENSIKIQIGEDKIFINGPVFMLEIVASKIALEIE